MALKYALRNLGKFTANNRKLMSTASNVKSWRDRAVKLSYVSYESPEEEEGSPVIIMHGLLGSKANWNSLAKQMHYKTKRKIIAVDARNHGDSPHSGEMNYYLLAEDVVKLMDDLGIEKATLVGHSMGGRAMMLLALTKPEAAETLVIVDTVPHRLPNVNITDFYLDRVQYVRFKPFVSVAEAKMEAYLQMIDLGIKEPMVRQFLLMNLVQDNTTGTFRWRINIPALANNFSANLATFPVLDDAAYEGPTYFIGGGRSEYLKKEDHAEILKFFPRAEFHYIAEAGHWLHAEKPAQFLEIFLDCLAKSK